MATAAEVGDFALRSGAQRIVDASADRRQVHDLTRVGESGAEAEQ